MESFVLDLSMSGDCGVTNSQGIEPFSYFGYCLFTTPIGLSPMDTVYENTANYMSFYRAINYKRKAKPKTNSAT